jgi:hypothetical protein
MQEQYEAVRVRIEGGMPSCKCGERKRRTLVTRTIELNSNNSTQHLFMQSSARLEAYILSITAATTVPTLYVASNFADANAQGNATVLLIGVNLSAEATVPATSMPVPLNTTDPVYVSGNSAAFPITVSVMAVYEGEEPSGGHRS